MASTTTDALNGLLYIRDGLPTARWNFPSALGSSVGAPAGIGTPVVLTYSFPSAQPAHATETGFQAFDAAPMQAARAVLAAIAEVADIGFNETTGLGQIGFAFSSQPAGQTGYAYTPGYSYTYSQNGAIESISELDNGGDVWLNRDFNWHAEDWQPGHDGYGTLLHEVGHALGLKHPFAADTANGYVLAAFLDDMAHTVMSYNQAPHAALVSVTGTPAGYSWLTTHLQPGTLMPLDIEALQYLYGANTATRSGDDVYTWAADAEFIETLWDGGGFDTLDCSNQHFDCVIDLRPGSYSSIGLRRTDAEIRAGLDLPDWFSHPLPADIYNGSDNLAIASGVVIESAIGGSGNDQITGNDADNLLDGRAGADTLAGGGGDDLYFIDDAGDTVTEFAAAGTWDTVVSRVAHDLSANVENLILNASLHSRGGFGGAFGERPSDLGVDGGGNDGDNLLVGNGAANRLTGGTGDDRIGAGAGDDLLIGGAGSDLLIGDRGRDTFLLDSLDGIDRIADFAAEDRLWFDHTVFGGLDLGALAQAAFASVPGPTPALDADVRLIHYTTSGALYYDSDGAGGTAAVEIAVLLTQAYGPGQMLGQLDSSQVWVI